MSRVSVLPVTLLLALVAAHPVTSRPAQVSPKSGGGIQSVFVTDGSPVHGAGELRVHASNWGAIGSMPGSGLPYAQAPSAEWPAGSRIEYLFVAGLWVGAMVGGVPAVSTSAFEMEFRPSQDSRDTVYWTAAGMAGGARIPFNPDDDRDGAVDEDPLDGFDNDGDGAVDEDHAAVADQMMTRRFRDDQPGTGTIYPGHTPMHLEVREESCAFAQDDYDDFVGFTFSITNTGADVLHDVYIGLMADGDVGSRDRANYWLDDAAGVQEVSVDLGARGTRRVAFPFWRDADGDGGEAAGYCGFALLDHTVDPTGASAPDSVALHTWVTIDGSAPFQDGGDPTNDFERYELMSSGVIARPVDAVDVRTLTAVGPFPAVAPGQTITLTVALVVTPDDFSNVARAAEAYDGRWFDLDHDPATGVGGREHHEPWYLPADALTPVWLAGVEAGPFGGSVRLRWGVVADQPLESIDVLRAVVGEGEPSVIATLAGGARQFIDSSAAPGARYAYRVVIHGVYGASYSSPSLEVKSPDLPTTFWQSYPNPFNDRTTLSAFLAARTDMSLAVFDAAGRRVRTLASGARERGDAVVEWDGTDDAGRRVPSGVYFARLEAEGRSYSQKLVIVR